MSKYLKIRHQAIELLENTSEGIYITEPDQLASYFSEDISFQSFMQYVYTKRIQDVLYKHKAQLKADLRKRWFMSNKTVSHELLYKLLANQDELFRLKGESSEAVTQGHDPLLDVLKPNDVWND